jgi:hypothetical protein
MSDATVKQRLRRARARIMGRWAAKGWDIYFNCDNPYHLVATKRGQIRYIDVIDGAIPKSNIENFVK